MQKKSIKIIFIIISLFFLESDISEEKTIEKTSV